VLGRSALPPTATVFGRAALARRLLSLATRHAQVAVKVPDSAAALGNVVLDAPDLAGHTASHVAGTVFELLRVAGWRGEFPLLVTGWEQPIVASPSVQLWVPRPDESGPLIEGVFDQLLIGRGGAFAGATPSSLPAHWRHRLAAEAARLAGLFQRLGYFGRCSFDAIIVGDGDQDWRLHWIECNGRWGGVSIPMTLANRLVGDWRRRPFVIVDRDGLRRCSRRLEDVLDDMVDELLLPGVRDTGLVILSPGRLEAGTGYNLMVLAESTAAARTSAGRICARLDAA
jgi:hypothetical protein